MNTNSIVGITKVEQITNKDEIRSAIYGILDQMKHNANIQVPVNSTIMMKVNICLVKGFGFRDVSVVQGFTRQGNSGYRRFEFVGHIVDEISLHLRKSSLAYQDGNRIGEAIYDNNDQDD